jgi:hypothetical protein
MVYAVSALAAGLSFWETLGMSLIVFAGASQFTAVGLFGSGANPWSIIAADSHHQRAPFVAGGVDRIVYSARADVVAGAGGAFN